jgi:2'-5' RNA ligase
VRRITAAKGLTGISEQLLSSLSLGATTAGQNELYSLYQRSSAIYACANIRADNMAAVRYQAVDASGSYIAHPVNAVFAESSGIRDALYRAEMSLFFNRAGALILPQSDIFGRFRANRINLWTLHPRVWDIRWGADDAEGFQIVASGGRYDNLPERARFIPYDAAIHLHAFGFTSDYTGVPPAEAAFLAADAVSEKNETIKAYFENRAVPATIIQPTADNTTLAASPKGITNLRDLLTALFKGSANQGRTLVTPDRIEAVSIETRLADMEIGQLSDDARRAIAEAAQIPIELLSFTASSYAQSREAVRFWRESWLVPRANWIADVFSAFFSAWYGEQITIKPNIVDLLKTDRTDMINAQVAAGYRDLYSAAVEVGIEAPDERLRGVYNLPGIGTAPLDRLGALVEQRLPPALYNAPVIGALPGLPGGSTAAPGIGLSSITKGEPLVAEQRQPLWIGLRLGRPAELVRLQQRCLGALPTGARAADDFHITLTEGLAKAYQADLLARALRDLDIPDLQALDAAAIGAFDTGSGYAAHLRIKRGPWIDALQRSLYAEALAAGVICKETSAPDAYIPHVTLAYADAPPPDHIRASAMKIAPCELVAAVGDKVIFNLPLGAPEEDASDRQLLVEKEIKNWRIVADKKGRDYPFVVQYLDAETERQIRDDLKRPMPLEMVFDRARRRLKSEIVETPPSPFWDAEALAELIRIWRELGFDDLTEAETDAAAKADAPQEIAARLLTAINGRLIAPDPRAPDDASARLNTYLDYFRQRVLQLAENLSYNRISLEAWREEMLIEIQRLHLTASVLGRGGLGDMSQGELMQALEYAEDQVRYLDRWVEQMKQELPGLDEIVNRALLYAGAASATYHAARQRRIGLPKLPAQPAERTKCRTNCGCAWEINAVNVEAGDYDCYWRRHKDDSCETCLTREAVWGPLLVRGGRILPYSDDPNLFAD